MAAAAADPLRPCDVSNRPRRPLRGCRHAHPLLDSTSSRLIFLVLLAESSSFLLVTVPSAHADWLTWGPERKGDAAAAPATRRADDAASAPVAAAASSASAAAGGAPAGGGASVSSSVAENDAFSGETFPPRAASPSPEVEQYDFSGKVISGRLSEGLPPRPPSSSSSQEQDAGLSETVVSAQVVAGAVGTASVAAGLVAGGFAATFADPAHLERRLTSVASSSSPSPSSSSSFSSPSSRSGVQDLHDALDQMLTWLSHNGVDHSALKVGVDHDNSLLTTSRARPDMHVRAARNITAGELFLVMPLSVQMRGRTALLYSPPFRPTCSGSCCSSSSSSSGNSSCSSNSSEVQQSMSGIEGSTNGTVESGWDATTALAAWILRERAEGTSSPWWPLIAMLPEHVSLPTYLDEWTLQQVQFQGFAAQVRRHQQGVRLQYNRCAAEKVANTTIDEFQWAYSIVFSRSFSGGPNGDAVTMPLADLFNHYSDFNALWHVEPDGTFTFLARDDIAAGDEIKIQYGAKDSDNIYLSYGFVPSDNVHDSFALLEHVSARNASREFYRLYYTDADSGQEDERRTDTGTGQDGERRTGADGEDGGSRTFDSHHETWLEYITTRAELALKEVASEVVTAAQAEEDEGDEGDDAGGSGGRRGLGEEGKPEADLVGEREIADGDVAVGCRKGGKSRWRGRRGRDMIMRSWGPRFIMDLDVAPALWHGGGLDARLVAVAASAWHYFAYRQEPDYKNIARLSIWYAWDYFGDSSCADLAARAGATDHELESVFAAVAAVRALAIHTANLFPTTLEEDKEEALRLAQCVAMEGRGEGRREEREEGRREVKTGEIGGEPVEGVDHGGDDDENGDAARKDLRRYCAELGNGVVGLLNVVRFRMMKKKILTCVVERIELTCNKHVKNREDQPLKPVEIFAS